MSHPPNETQALIDQGIRHYVLDRETLKFFDPRTKVREHSNEETSSEERLNSLLWLSDVNWEWFR